MDVRIGLWRRLSAEELMLLNCGVGEDSWESLGLQRDPTSPFWRSVLGFLGRNDAKAETPVLWPPHVKSWLIGKDSDAGRECGQEEKGTTEDKMAGWHHWLDGREWVNSGSWWWTGRLGVLRFMGSQRVGHDWVAELNWTEPFHRASQVTLVVKKNSTCQCRKHKRCGFDPLVEKIPWRKAWLPSLVSLPGESHGERNLVSTVHRVAESHMTEVT